jgi:alpha-ribazole phosphatase
MKELAMNLYVMRHGQTNYNLMGLCNDDPNNDVYLTETGIKQAETAAKELADIPLSKIYVSELKRTHLTADAINHYHNAPIITSHYLNDIKSGFNGKPVSEYFSATGHNRYNITPPGGESVKEFQSRVLKFLDEINQAEEQNILVVTHEEAMRVFYAYFNNLNPEEMLRLDFGNCELLQFTL